MTPSQQKLFKYVTDFDYSNTPMRVFCHGIAGCGKTFMIRLLTEYFQHRFGGSTYTPIVKLGSVTGTASQHINGQTLHSLLKLRVKVRKGSSRGILNGPGLTKLQTQWKHVKFLIIDEISMVSSFMLKQINNRLMAIKETDNYFGNIHILLFGDPFQIKPVMGSFFFQNTELWPLFTVFELVENMRQNADQEYAQMLNRIRVGKANNDDILALYTRLLPEIPPDFEDAIRLYPDKQMAAEYNAQQQAKLQTCHYAISASHYYTGISRTHATTVLPEHIPDDENRAGGILQHLTVSVGTRVLLVHNINVRQKLCNGALGTVTYIQTDPTTNFVTEIFVLFDNPLIGQQTSGQRAAIPICKIDKEYMIDGKSVVRRNFPLMPAWALTLHRAQGATYQQSVIYLGREVFEPQMAYVALSRVQSLDGLILTALDPSILRPFPIVLQHFCQKH